MITLFQSPVWANDGAGGGAAPSPAVDSGAAAPVSAGDEPAVSSTDFSGLSGDDYVPDSGTLEVTQPQSPAVTPASQPSTVGTQPPVQASVQQPQAPQQQPAAQQTQPQPQQSETPPAQTATQAPQSIGDVMKILAENEGAAIEAIAQSQFALSDEDRVALETDAVGAVPKLLAKSYVKTLQGMSHMIQQHMPAMIASQVASMQRQASAETQFFQQFPSLNRATHGDSIRTLGVALRQQFPTMPANELLTKLGQTVMALHGVQPQPAVPVPGRPQQMTPFAPALPGARVVQQQQVTDGQDWFTGLSGDYETP